MKLIFRRILPGLLLASMLTLPALGQNQKIATIDLRKVFDNYWKRQEAQAALQKRGADFDKELKGMMGDYNKLQDDYKKLLESANDQSVTPEERDRRKAAAQNKMAEIDTSKNSIRTFEDNAREQIETQRKRMRDSILDDIRTAVKAKAQSGSYTMVIDVAAESANGTPVLMYNSGDNDITDAILSQLNINAPPPSTTTNDVPAASGKPNTTGNK